MATGMLIPGVCRFGDPGHRESEIRDGGTMLHKSLVLICGAALLLVANQQAVIAQTAAPAFVPGDLVLGYQSQTDRDQALQSFHQVRDNASMRGAPTANADFEAV